MAGSKAGPEKEAIETRREAAKDRKAQRVDPYVGLRGSARDKLRNVQTVGTHDTGLENDPEIEAAITDDDRATVAIDDESDVEQVMNQALEEVGEDSGVRAYPIGNGTTLPFPFDGEYTTDVSTCSPSIAGVNRGCGHHSIKGKPHCPFSADHPVAKEHGWEGGSCNLVYKDLRTGRVKTCHCTSMMSTYLKMPNIVLLPTNWYPTRTAEYAPLPNGQQPMPGPNQPRTKIILTPNKTNVGIVPPPELVTDVQKMRRRGDFEPKPARGKHRRRR